MSIDHRSFRIGILAGVFLLSGVLVGVLFSAGSGWMSPAASAPVASPVTVMGGSNGFPAVAKATMPAVVNISTTRVVKSQGGPASRIKDDQAFRHFFGDQLNKQFQIPRERRENSLGSGVPV